MANNITVELTPKDAEMVSAWQRQRENLASFADGLQKTHGEAKNLTDGMIQGFKGVGESLLNSFLGFEAVRKVGDFVVDAYREQAKELTEVVAKQRESREELTHMLALSGQIKAGPEVEKALDGITTATKAEKLTSFKAVGEAAPNLSTTGQYALVRELAPIAEVVGEQGLAGIS
jgi:hypothetical protein